MSTFFGVVLSCVGRGLAMGRSPVQAVLPTCPKIDAWLQKSNSDSEQSRGPNPNNNNDYDDDDNNNNNNNVTTTTGPSGTSV